jgi:hypothetical protein
MAHHVKCIRFVKGIVFILCVGLFIANSLDNAQQYISGKTTLAQDLEPPGLLTLPSFTFCNKSGFKNYEANLKLADFRKNTIKAEDIFLDPIPELRSVHSRYFGHCFTYTSTKKVFYLV